LLCEWRWKRHSNGTGDTPMNPVLNQVGDQNQQQQLTRTATANPRLHARIDRPVESRMHQLVGGEKENPHLQVMSRKYARSVCHFGRRSAAQAAARTTFE